MRDVSEKPFVPSVDLSGWILGDLLGEGGQALAYKATKPGIPGTAVIKILKPWDADSSKAKSEKDQRLRFRREVLVLRDLADLGCPGIVRILEPRELDLREGVQPWYAMPCYEPGPMCRHDKNGKVKGWAEGTYQGKLERVLEIAEKVAITLDFIHQRTPIVVHRDIHVGNIFFASAGGEPLVGDFGLAHYEFPGDTLRTGQREEFGPWRWRPPELTAGSPNYVDAKSDVYLLGGVIYEALSGGEYIEQIEFPAGRFKHDQAAFALGRFTSDPRVPHLDALLRNMWSYDPAARLSAKQVAAACRQLIEWRTGMHSPIPPEDELKKAASEFRTKSEEYRKFHLRMELYRTCERVVQPVRVTESSQPYQFHRDVAQDLGDGCAASIQGKYSSAVWAAIRVLVRFEPGSKIWLTSHIALIRTRDNEEVIAIVDENGAVRELAKSFPGDPAHDGLMQGAATKELERLQMVAVEKLRKLGPS